MPLLQETTLENQEFPEATEIIHGLWVGTAEAGIEATVGVNSRQSLGKQEKFNWMFPKIVGFPPKSSILIGFSIINHPFWGTPYFWKHPTACKMGSPGFFHPRNFPFRFRPINRGPIISPFTTGCPSCC